MDSEQQVFERSPADAYRVVPLLRVDAEVLVGKVFVAVDADSTVRVDVVPGVELKVPDEPGPPQEMAAVIAKSVAEQSRNAVAQLRNLRYGLEQQLADRLGRKRNGVLREVLAEIIELSMTVNRARDHVRETIREGMWLWLTDDDAYHGRTAPDWLPLHQAALRHLETMDALLGEESDRLHSLLDAMSTVAVAQDGEAQQRFNLLAAAVAAGLGLPALILSLYGADPFMPLNSFDRAWRALLPIGVVGLLAAGIALWRMPGRARPRQFVTAAGLVLALVGLLFLAGTLVPGS